MDALFDSDQAGAGAAARGGTQSGGGAGADVGSGGEKVDGGGASAAVAVAQAVIDSPVFQARAQRGNARGLPEQAVTRAVLACLLERGGRAHTDVLAQAVGIPAARRRNLLAALARALNLDGYQVIFVDPDGVTVVLDEALLREQFGVASGDGTTEGSTGRGTNGPGGR